MATPVLVSLTTPSSWKQSTFGPSTSLPYPALRETGDQSLLDPALRETGDQSLLDPALRETGTRLRQPTHENPLYSSTLVWETQTGEHFLFDPDDVNHLNDP